MTKGQEQVKEFMEFFGQQCPDKPTVLTEDIAKLRATLILEEAFETILKGLGLRVDIVEKTPDVEYPGDGLEYLGRIGKDNIANIKFEFVKESEQDLVELADGLADLAYVGEFGTAVAAGIDLEPIQDHVHASNMSKAWTEDDLAKAGEGNTIEKYYGNLYRVKRPDGKVIKSPSYKAPNILPLINAQSL